MKPAVLLVNPPICKPSEPPAGIARLAGALRMHGIACHVLDAGLECLLWLLEQQTAADDTWTRRARSARLSHLEALRDPSLYRSPNRYRRAVSDLNRLAAVNSYPAEPGAGLADFNDRRFSALSSIDLLAAARQPEASTFHGWFGVRLLPMLDGIDTVGISICYLSQAVSAFAMIGFIRHTRPDIRIIAGGGLVTSWISRPGWKNPFSGLIHELVAGPGEERLLRFCGIEHDGGHAVVPDYDGFSLGRYLSPGMVLPYSAASGCWWNRCSFCPERAEGNRYAPVGAARAADELRRLTVRHRPALIHLLDNAVSPSLLATLADDPPGAPWYGFARFGDQLDDPGFCRRLARSGCVMLKLGLESGDQQVLDRLDKGIDLAVASRVLVNLHEAGIAVYCYLLFGTPEEDQAAACRTLDFTVRHHQAITFLNLALFNMPAHGAETARYETAPFYDGDLSLYTSFRHPLGWERRQVRNFLEKEFKRHPAVSPILRNDPPVFTSNHAAFFALFNK